MAINFGLASLRALRNGIETACAATSGADAAGTGTGIIVSSGSVWLDGINCILSGVTQTLGAGNSGTGCWLVATLPSGNTSTAAATAMISDPTGLIYALLDRFSFGSAANNVTLLTGAAGKSATTALITFGRAYNVAINITYDNAIARGGTLIFADDMKIYNGAVEGNAEYAEMNVENLSRIFGGGYASAGSASGTFNVSATNKPLPFMLEAKVVTDSITGTFRLLKCYSSQLALSLDRENFLIPNFNFVAVANKLGDIINFTE